MKSFIIPNALIFSLMLISYRAGSQTVNDSMLFNNLVAQYANSGMPVTGQGQGF
jgi:hypothetical protein